jgi:hypothetical protein
VYRSLRLWDRLDTTARKMRDKAKIQYSMKHQQRKRNEYEKKLSRPMFVYITYADLLCASVCEAQGDYEQALQFTYTYADLSWVTETDADTQHWVKLFQDWAEGNTYVYKLLSGDLSTLQNYVNYIVSSSDNNEREMIASLMNIVMAANQYNIDVDDILQRFKTEIDYITQQQSSADMYTHQVIPEQSTRFKYELEKYYLNRGNYLCGFKFLLDVLSKSLAINKEAFFISCIRLFEQFKSFADTRLYEKYESLVNKGRKERLFYY